MSKVAFAKKYEGTQIRDVKKAAAKINKVIRRVKDADHDGYFDSSEFKQALKGEKKEMWSAVLGTLASYVGYAHNDPQDLGEVIKMVNGAVAELMTIDDYGAKPNGKLEYEDLRAITRRMPERVIELAGASGKNTADLKDVLNEAAKDAMYVSESDSTPTFSGGKRAGGMGPVLSNEMLREFSGEIASFYDEQDGDISNYAIEKYSSNELKEWWDDVTTDPGEGAYGSGSYAAGWKKLQKALSENVTELGLFRVGPKDEDGKVKDDYGSYLMYLVGRDSAGRIAGVHFESVQT